MIAQKLDQAISAVCPIFGVSIGRVDDRLTWRIDFKPEATQAQKDAAQNVLATFVYPTAAEIAAVAAKQSIDAAISTDTTLAQLKAMTNAEFDAWWAANITTAVQAISILKRLAKLVIRRLA